MLTHCGANPYYVESSPWSKATTPAYSDFPKVVEFCHRWENVKIIVAHCCTLAGALYNAVSDLDNVYTDTSMCSAAMMRYGAFLMGEDKILFGTDVPFGSYRYSLAELRKAFGGKPDTLDKVGYANIAALLNII